MNVQNTPVHVGLWNKDFWLMAMANLLLSLSVTMLIPTLPHQMLYAHGLSSAETGWAMGAFALGLFLPGPFCSYLVQRYRRNEVCVWAISVLAVTIVAPVYGVAVTPMWAILLRVVQGAAFGLAQMVLTSTLIIDASDSYQRTEANHSSTWFGRFALSLGPMLGLLLLEWWHYEHVAWIAAISCGMAILLILLVRFPFRVPTDRLQVCSLDRFLLIKGTPLLLSEMAITLSIGLVLSLPHDARFYGFMMIGFLLALLAGHFVFRTAELKSEVVTGLLLIAASLLIMLTDRQSPLTSPLLALGLGIVGTRYLLFFIKLSRHCQRGTSQSSFMLGWESGLALGVGMGYACFDRQSSPVLSVALVIILLVLLLYVVWVHRWFMTHKNR